MNYTRYYLSNGQLLSELVEYEPPDTLAEQAGGDAYAKDIRGIARAVWQGLAVDAYSIMWETVGLGITKAWAQGAASCGISEDELTFEERNRRNTMVAEQRNYIWGFLAWVHEHRRDGPDKLLWRVVVVRANSWQRGFRESYNFGMVMACGDQKLAWRREVLRKVEKGCNDCLNYEGRVYRSSTWQRYGIRPQHPGLGCKGWGACGFEVTDERCTPGRPPQMTGT